MTKAQTKETLQVISNSKALIKDIQDAARRVEALKKQRGQINKDIAAVRASMEAKGVDKRAFDDTMALFASNRMEREGYAEGVALVREALEEIQGELFPSKKEE